MEKPTKYETGQVDDKLNGLIKELLGIETKADSLINLLDFPKQYVEDPADIEKIKLLSELLKELR